MLKEEKVSSQIGCALKEKGFPQIHAKNSDEVITPTLSLVAKWLREEKSISCEVYRTACGYVAALVDIPSGTDILFLRKEGDEVNSGQYTTYEKALSAAICKALELITK